jgi:hypothetical protein
MSTNIVRLAKEFVVVFNNLVIARCRDFSLSLGDTKIDISSFDSDSFEEHIRGNKNWSISFGSMVSRDHGSPTGGATGYGSGTFMNLFDHWASSAGDYPVTIKLGDTSHNPGTGNSYDYFEGKGTITLDMSGANNDIIGYTGNVQGSGSLKRPVK